MRKIILEKTAVNFLKANPVATGAALGGLVGGGIGMLTNKDTDYYGQKTNKTKSFIKGALPGVVAGTGAGLGYKGTTFALKHKERIQNVAKGLGVLGAGAEKAGKSKILRWLVK